MGANGPTAQSSKHLVGNLSRRVETVTAVISSAMRCATITYRRNLQVSTYIWPGRCVCGSNMGWTPAVDSQDCYEIMNSLFLSREWVLPLNSRSTQSVFVRFFKLLLSFVRVSNFCVCRSNYTVFHGPRVLISLQCHFHFFSCNSMCQRAMRTDWFYDTA